MQRSSFKKSIRTRIQNSLEANMPDVWANIETGVREQARQGRRLPFLKMRWVPAAGATVAGLAVAVTCAAVLLVHSPAFTANTGTLAETSGGAQASYSSGAAYSSMAGFGTVGGLVAPHNDSQKAGGRTGNGSTNSGGTGNGSINNIQINNGQVNISQTGNGQSGSGQATNSGQGSGQSSSSSAAIPSVPADLKTIYDDGGHLSNLSTTDPDSSFVNSYNTFGVNLLKKLYSQDSNVFLSPASIYLDLGMVRNGAAGQTASEFDNMFGNTGGLDALNQNCLDLQSLMSGSSFRLANSIWLSNAFSSYFSNDFLSRDEEYFGSSVFGINFGSPDAPSILKNWVSKNTNNLINPEFKDLDSSTVMVLINTIYFKSGWALKFPTDATSSGSFQTPNGAKTVQYMYDYGRGNYFENSLLQGILLPYDDKKTSMLILLPKTNLTNMLGQLTPSDIAGYVKDNQTKPISIYTAAQLWLPRMELRYSNSIRSALQSLGLQSAFGTNANFSGMAENSGGLHITDVMHRTYLNVDEDGTTAAAETDTGVATAAPPWIYPEMKVDHPFFAAIVDNKTGALLFAGTITDPTAQ